MSRMIIEGVVNTDLALAGTNAGIRLLLSVTDADGKSYTGLQPQNFGIQLMDALSRGIDSRIFQFDEENKEGDLFREHVPGIYLLTVINTSNQWFQITYTLIVKVQEQPVGAPRNHGQTLFQFSIPRTF